MKYPEGSPQEEAGESKTKEMAERLHYAHQGMARAHEAIAKTHVEAAGYHTGRGNKEIAGHHKALAEQHSNLAALHKSANDATGKVAMTMGEFKQGILHSGSKQGPKVTNRKQAVAIALSQARRAKAPKSVIGGY